MEEDVHYDGMAPSMLPMIVQREELEKIKDRADSVGRNTAPAEEQAKKLEAADADRKAASRILVSKIVAETSRMIERQREKDAPNGLVGLVITSFHTHRNWYWPFKKFYEPQTEFAVLFKFAEARQQWGGDYISYYVDEYGAFYRTGASTYRGRDDQRTKGRHLIDPTELSEMYSPDGLQRILNRLQAM